MDRRGGGPVRSVSLRPDATGGHYARAGLGAARTGRSSGPRREGAGNAMKKTAAVLLVLLLGAGSSLGLVYLANPWSSSKDLTPQKEGTRPANGRGVQAVQPQPRRQHAYEPRKPLDTSGMLTVLKRLTQWQDATSLEEVRESWANVGRRSFAQVNAALSHSLADGDKC